MALRAETIRQATTPSSDGETDRYLKLPLRWSEGRPARRRAQGQRSARRRSWPDGRAREPDRVRPHRQLRVYRLGLGTGPDTSELDRRGESGIASSAHLRSPAAPEDGRSARRLRQAGYYWDKPMCWLDNTPLPMSGIGADDEAMSPGVEIYDANSGMVTANFAGPQGQPYCDAGRLYSASPGGMQIRDIRTGTTPGPCRASCPATTTRPVTTWQPSTTAS
jgi:hypothetical protein